MARSLQVVTGARQFSQLFTKRQMELDMLFAPWVKEHRPTVFTTEEIHVLAEQRFGHRHSGLVYERVASAHNYRKYGRIRVGGRMTMVWVRNDLETFQLDEEIGKIVFGGKKRRVGGRPKKL